MEKKIDKVATLRHLYLMMDAIMTLKHHSMRLGEMFGDKFPQGAMDGLDEVNTEIMRFIIMIVEPNARVEREQHIATILEAAMRRGSGATKI